MPQPHHLSSTNPAPPVCTPAAEVTRAWRDTALENCELRAQIALLAAGGSAGSRSVGSGSGGGSGSDLGSPLGGLDRLGGGLGLSPGWGGSPTGMLM